MNKKIITGILAVIIAVLLVAGIIALPIDIGDNDSKNTVLLDVIVFDVGQADCTLLKMDDHAMLIDAGNTGQDKLVLSYLSEYGVTTLDYLVATHPHADHIGSMASVVNAMDSIGTVLMPDVTHTISAYKNLITAIDNKNIPLTIPTPGDVFQWGDARVEVLAPNSATYPDNDLNEYSIVLRVEFGDTSFLFTGDAGAISENEQLAVGASLKSDVLKVGHHGSRGSSTQKYLDIVAPSYAVICCGIDNSYGHPHAEAMTRLTGTSATIYRTDHHGTVTFTTDGKDITVSISRDEPPPTRSPELDGYIGNKNSMVFHRPSCGSLPGEANRVELKMTRDEAINAGYTPCGNCKP
jgi:competence protein ComEC